MINPFLTRPIPKPKKEIADDPQRERLYKMEREFVGMSVYHHVRLKDLVTIANHACRYYGVPAPKVVIYSEDERVFGYSQSGKIHLNRAFHGNNVVTLLHELAHYITDQFFEGNATHGPKFVGVYMHLLHKYRIIPSDAFRVIAKRWNVKIAGRFRPAALR